MKICACDTNTNIKIFVKDVTNKGSISKIYKQLCNSISCNNNPIKKWLFLKNTQICSNTIPSFFFFFFFFWAEKGLLQGHARKQVSQATEKPRALRRILAKHFLSFLLFFKFTILYWLCHISTWIHHRYTRVPHP